jgi:DNA-binding MarR family transcriptional regulator
MKEKHATVAFLLANTFRHLAKRIRKRFIAENLPITGEQFGILDMISRKDESIQSDLASLMDKDKSAILRHIDVLETNKLVMRINDPVDRRKKFLVVTKPGEEMLKKGKQMLEETFKELTQGIPPDKIENFRDVLEDILRNVGE